jgi:hypothetical protein
MTDATCRRCTYYWDTFDTCASNALNCPYWARLTGPARDLHASGVPDPMLVTGPSIRRDLARAGRGRRLLAWLESLPGDAETWFLIAFAIALFALVLAWGQR